MRVAMVIQSYVPVLGGAQRQVQRLGPRLNALGVSVDVVTRHPEGTPRREHQPGVEVHRIPGTRGGPTRASLAYTAGGVATLLRLKPDVLHAHDLLSPATVALTAGAILRRPVVVKALSAGRSGDVDRLLTKPLGARRLREMARRVAAFVCLSDDVRAELEDHGVPPDRLVQIPNGVDLEHFRPASPEERAAARGRLGLPRDGAIAVYCGRFAEIKRVDVLLQAFRRAPGHLVLVGEGPEEHEIRRLAKADGLRDRVTIMPTVADTGAILAAADVYASASVTEGMSGSVLEAMAAGLAVAASPASGMQELLGDGAGIVAADASAGRLEDALRLALAEPERRAAMGTAARNRVTQR